MSSGPPVSPAHGAFHPRPSLPAIVLSGAMVAAAVLFGIYGPSIAGRQSHGGGTPLADLVNSAAEARADQITGAMAESEEPDLHPEEARAALRQLVQRSTSAPDLRPLGYTLRRVAPVSLAGAPYRAAALTYRGDESAPGRWVVIFLAADDGQFLSYDSLGRPRPLAPDITLEGEMPTPQGTMATALVWSDSPVLWVASFDDEDEAERLRDAVGAP